VHPSFGHFFKPEKYASSEAAQADVKQMGKQSFFENLKEIDGILAGKQWVMGDQFTVADPYSIVFYGWGVRAELPVQELKSYTAWKDRMLARPAVRKVLESEGNVLVKE
jgi:glutathione S-transferase